MSTVQIWTRELPDRQATADLAHGLAPLLSAGDLLILTGDLGAGKTTFTQSLGAALGVAGPIISPTFVLARVYPTRHHGLDLVHIDAYRLGSAAELHGLGIEDSMSTSITVVEWGRGVAESLAGNPDDRQTGWLDIELRRRPASGSPTGTDVGDGPDPASVEGLRFDFSDEEEAEGGRHALIRAHGVRWQDAGLEAVGARGGELD